MQISLRVPQQRIPIDADLFLRAAQSYPDRFHEQPGVSFEQHILNLAAASQVLTRSVAAGQ